MKRFRRTTLLPVPLVLALVGAGAVAGWLVLELTDSQVAMCVAGALVSWGGVYAARRLRAARGRGETFGQLPSVDYDERSSLRRNLGGRLLAVAAYFGGFLVLYGLLNALGMDGPSDDAAGLNALVVAVPLWIDVDARMGVRAARKRAAEQEALEADVEPRADLPAGAEGLPPRERERLRRREERLTAHDERSTPAELPMSRLGPTAVALVVGLALPAGFAAAIVDSSDILVQLVMAALGLVTAWVGLELGRVALTSPYFIRVTHLGVDLLGAGEVPWADIAAVGLTAGQGNRFLELGLEAPQPERKGWYTKGHRRLARRMKGRGLSASMLLSREPDALVLRAVRTHSDLPVDVFLGA